MFIFCSVRKEIQRSCTLYFMYSSNFMLQIDLSSVHEITKWLKFPKYWHDTRAVLKNFIDNWCITLKENCNRWIFYL